MSSVRWEDLEPDTQRQIEFQPWDTGYGTNPPTLRTCGCEVFGDAWRLCQYHDGVQDGASEVRAEVERLTAELAVEKAEHAETTRELNRRYTELADDGARLAAAEAREKALRDVLDEAFRTETVRDLHDWLERAKRGGVT